MKNYYKFIVLFSLLSSGCAATQMTSNELGHQNPVAGNYPQSRQVQSLPLQSSQMQETSTDADYPGKSRVRLTRGNVSKIEAQDYCLSLAKQHSEGIVSVIAIEKVNPHWLRTNISDYADIDSSDKEQYYIVNVSGDFRIEIPVKNGNSVARNFNSYRLLIREKDGWLMDETFTNI